MSGNKAIGLRLGVEGDDKIIAALKQIGQSGDQAFAGLSRTAKEAARSFDRMEKSLDIQARSAAEFARTYVAANNAVAAGVRTQADAQRVLDMAAERHRRLTGEVNDNAHAVGLARHEWINLSRQFQDIGVSLAGGQSPLTVLFQQGSQVADIFSSSGAGAGAALRSFGSTAVRALFSPIGAATALGAAIGGIAYEADSAREKLAKLGEQARLTGLPADVLQGAKAVGAGAGLDEKGALGAFGNAAKEFQAYGRNSGAVKSTLENIDKGFLTVVDRARSAVEFIDILNEKIRKLPTAQAEQLAKALYSDEGGAKLADALARGEVSMRALLEASGSTGSSLNQSAREADDMKNKIAQAAQEADNKLLLAFKNIVNPIDQMKLGWYEIVGSIAQAVSESKRLQGALNGLLHPIDTYSKFFGNIYNRVDKMLGARPVVSINDAEPARAARPGEIPFPNFNEAKQGFLPGLVNDPVGDTRRIFEATRVGHKSGAGAAEKHAETYAKVARELENQLRLASSVGAEHDKVVLAIKIENEQLKLGKDATQAELDNVSVLVTKIDAAGKAQGKLNDEAKAYSEAFREVRDVAKDSLKGFIHDLEKGDSLSKSLHKSWESFRSKMFDKATDSLVDSLLGKSGDKSDFGLLGSLFGGAKNLFGGSGGGSGYFQGGALFSGSPFTFGFADGGVMTSRGPLPLRRYAGGGIADSPQLAMFGEGRMPEAYVPLPDGRSIPVAMRGQTPNVTVINQASGVEVTPRMTPQGVALIVQEIGAQMIRANNQQLPGLLGDARRRGNR
jgi:hypothetical protein